MAANGEKQGPRALKKALKDKGWSQRELARQLGVSPSTVTRWLNGERAPDRAHMGGLRKLLQVSSEVWVS
jgi:transcriptional regulator with XRE-family HTH domain